MNIIYQEIGLNQAFLSKMPKNGIKLLNWFIDQMLSKPSIKISIKDIMICTGIPESTLHRWIAKFKKWGILKVEQLYGPYSHNTFTLERKIFQYAKHLKYQLESIQRYLFFVYKRFKSSSETPYIVSNVIKPSISISISEREKKAPVFNTRGLKKQIKEKMDSVMQVAPPKISDVLRDITEKLRLTKLGQLKLLVFHENVLSDAWSDYKKLSKINNPFDYLIVNCVKKSENRNIPVYWDLYYTSLTRYELTDNKKYVLPYNQINAVDHKSRDIVRPYRHITAIDKSNPFFKDLQVALQNMENSSIEAH